MLAALALAAALEAQTPERSGTVVVYGEDIAVSQLEAFARRSPPRLVKASQATREDLDARRLVLVGTRASNPFLAELDVPGLRLHERGFTWDGIRYDDDCLLQLRARSPWRADGFVEAVIGRVDAPVQRRRADVHVRRDGRTVLLGFEGEGGYSTRAFSRASAPSLETEYVRFFLQGGSTDSDRLRALARTLGELSRRTDVHVYPSLEVKGLITDDTTTVHEEDGAFHVVLGLDDRPARAIVEAELSRVSPLLLRRGRAALRVSTDDALDELDDIARRLLSTSDPPSLAELSDDAVFQATSPFVTDAVSASFARFAEGRPSSISELEPEWKRSLLSRPATPKPIPAPQDGFQRGFTFAHQGYRIHDGYLSEHAVESLSRLESLGTNAVAVVPYAFMRSPSEIVPLEVPTRAGSETDDGVRHAIRAAESRGMTVLLKPQIWVRGSWPGDIDGATDGDDARFFEEYRRWIRHYALMAEREGVPLLAVGTELEKMTSGHRDQWARLIEDVRCLYGGKLVYAANWGREVQHVDFWDLLDYIGVDFYYPLSFEPEPSDEALIDGFASALETLRSLHERHQKPVLFTEIGYASTKSPWTKPHASDRVHEVSLEDQARAYEVALSAITDNREWIEGVYWWKWPSTLAIGGPAHRGFTPNGKLAEGVVGRWYRGRLQ